MKKLCFLFVVLLFLTGCKKVEERDPARIPAIELDIQGNMKVGAAGCDTSLVYRIVNPVDGGSFSAVPSEEWISGLDYDKDGVLGFTVSPNGEAESRSAILTLLYEYGGDSTASAEINVIQEGTVEIEYDYELEATYFDGLYYGTQQTSVYYSYYTWISSLPFDEFGFFYVGGTYYVLDMYTATPPDDENDPRPPVGTYRLGSLASVSDMMFSMDYSRRVAFDDEGNRYPDCYWSDGVLEVSRDGDIYTFDASLTDLEGKTHHLTYTGEIFYVYDEIDDGEIPLIDHDIEMEAVTASGSYMSDANDVMWVSMSFTDMTVDEDYFLQPPGTQLFVSAFMPFDQDGNIAEGTYTVMEDYGDANTLAPGEIDREAQFPYPNGTYARYYRTDTDYSISMATEGTMTVSGTAGNYTIVCDFELEGGYSVKCTYTGPVEIIGIPGPYSTLTEDYTLNMEGNVGTAYYYGDYYFTGGSNWIIEIVPENLDNNYDYDGIIAEIQANTEEFSEGLGSGTYVPSPNDYLMPGEYYPGQMSYAGELSGTNFLGDFGSQGVVTAYAPATSGNLDITDNGDGTYTFSFSFLDDKGHTWDGLWTGQLKTVNSSENAPAVRIPYRYNAPGSEIRTGGAAVRTVRTGESSAAPDTKYR